MFTFNLKNAIHKLNLWSYESVRRDAQPHERWDKPCPHVVVTAVYQGGKTILTCDVYSLIIEKDARFLNLKHTLLRNGAVISENYRSPSTPWAEIIRRFRQVVSDNEGYYC